LDHFRQADALVPLRPEVLYSLAVTHEMLGESEQTITILRQIMQMKQAPALAVGTDLRQARIKAFMRLEHLLCRLGRNQEEWEAAEQALEFGAERPEVHNIIGTLFFRQTKYMDALHAFEKSLAIAAAGNIIAFIGLVLVASRAGQHKQALATLMTMKQLFASLSLYWAFHAIVFGDEALGEMPQTITAQQLGVDKEHIYQQFGFGPSVRGVDG
jgi:tetratricopeptide (TPR) repeat protein